MKWLGNCARCRRSVCEATAGEVILQPRGFRSSDTVTIGHRCSQCHKLYYDLCHTRLWGNCPDCGVRLTSLQVYETPRSARPKKWWQFWK